VGKAGLIIPTNNLKLCNNAQGEVLAAGGSIIMQDVVGKLQANYQDF
jgi:hypothetical protein